MVYYAVSSAIYGDPTSWNKTFKTTVAKANNKNDMEVVEEPNLTWDDTIDLTDTEDVRLKFNRFLKTIDATLRLQVDDNKATGQETRVPIVFGCDDPDFDGANSRILQSQCYSLYDRSLMNLVGQSRLESVNTDLKYYQLLLDVFTEVNGLPKIADLFLRDFYSYDSDEEMNVIGAIADKRDNKMLDELHRRVGQGEHDAKKQLDAKVEKLADQFVMYVSKLSPSRESRFFCLGSKEDKGSAVHNYIKWYDEYRELLKKYLKAVLNTKHNFVVKCPDDDSKRPFYDVAWTYIADMIDGIYKIPIRFY